MSRKRLILILLTFFFVNSSKGFESTTNSISNLIFEAATDVLKLHDDTEEEDDQNHGFEVGSNLDGHETETRNKRSVPFPLGNVPKINTEMNRFRHGYIPFTGTGNREVMTIRPFVEEMFVRLGHPVFENELKSWKYIRFNSSDFVMLTTKHEIHVWQKKFTDNDNRFHFDEKQSICSVGDVNEEVLHSLFYTKVDDFVETLHLAYIVRTLKDDYKLYNRDMSMDRCKHSTVIELDSRRPLALRFVQMQGDASLFVLYNDNNEVPNIRCIDCRRSDTKLVDVSIAYAIDLELFVINGNAFAAVAHKNGLHVFTFEESFEEKTPILFRRLDDISDLVFFSIGFKNFLGIATKNKNQFLMQWNEERFIDKQLFDIPQVIQWNAIHISTCREDVILIFHSLDQMGQKAKIPVFVWNGNNDEFELRIPDMGDVLKLAPKFYVQPFSQANVIYNSIANVLLLDTKGSPHVIAFHTELKPLIDPVFVTQNRITNILQLINKRFGEQKSVMQRMKEVMKHAVRASGKEKLVILVKQDFKSIEAKNDAILHRVENLKKVLWQKSALNLEEFRKYELKDLSHRFHQIKKAVEEIRHNLQENVVYTNRPSRIEGKVTFKGHISSRVVNASNLHIERIVDEPLTPILNDVFHFGGTKRPIIGTKTFLNPIVIHGNLNSPNINGLKLSKDVVLSDRPNVIKGELHLRSTDVKNHLNIHGKVNGIRIPDDLIFLRGKKYRIPAQKNFTNPLTIIDKLLSRRIDGVNVHNLPKTILMKYGNQHISSPIIAEQPILMKNILLKDKLNGQNFNSFINDLVRIDSPTRITGHKRFRNTLLVRNDLQVGHLINGLRIPHDLVMTNIPQQIVARKTFYGTLTFRAPVIVKKHLNGLVFPADVIRLDDDRPINTTLVFTDGITVHNDIRVDGLVDGVNIRKLDEMALKKDSNRIHGLTVFKGPVFVTGNMDIKQTANGIDLPRLYNDAIFIDNKDPIEVKIRGEKRFRKPVVFSDDLEVQTINDKRLNNFAIIDKRKGLSLDSKLIFNAPVNFSKVVVSSGRIGNVDIPLLVKRRLSLTRKGRIIGGQHFQKINVKQLIVDGRLNGLIPDKDFVTKGSQQVIRSTKIFKGTVIFEAGLALKKNLFTRGRIQGVDVSHLAANRITLSGDQRVWRNMSFAETTFENLDLKRGQTFNGIDFNEFADSILYKDGFQVISAPKNFESIFVVGNITSDRGINGVSLRILKNNAMRLFGDQVIRASGFENDLIVHGKVIVESGSVNGHDLNHFVFDSMKKFTPNLMIGQNTFLNGVSVDGNLHTKWINGINPSTDLFLKTRHNRIHGNVAFEELVIHGNTYVKGLINGLNLAELDRRIMKTNRINYLHGTINFKQPLHISGNLYVYGNINHANFTHAAINGLKVYGNQEIPGSLILQSRSEFESNIYAERINGIHIENFLNDIVYINSKEVQIISAPKHFVNGFRVEKDLEQNYGETRIFGPINNINLHQLVNSMVFIDKSAVIKGEVIFKDEIHIRSSNGLQLLRNVNGFKFDEIVLLHKNPGNKPQLISGLRFNTLIADDNIFVKGTVNGINLAQMASDTLLRHGDQYITGDKFAVHDVLLGRGADVKRLNGFDLQDVVLIHEHRNITGLWTFDHLRIKGNLNIGRGLLADHLHQLSHESLKTNRPVSIWKKITFERIVFEDDVHIIGLLNGFNVSHFTREFNAFSLGVNKTMDQIRDRVIDNFLDTAKLKGIYKRPNFQVDYFTLFQELSDVNGNHFKSYGNYSYSVSELNKEGNRATIHSLHFNKHFPIFELTDHKTGQKYLEKQTFKFCNLEYTIYRSSPFNRTVSIIEQNGKLISNLGTQVDDISVLHNQEQKEMLIATLSSLLGEVNLFLLQKVGDKHQLKKIGTLVVSPETNKIALFQIEKWYFVGVARSFQHSCPTSDTGSLIFQWVNRQRLELIQRLPIHSNDVLYYNHNHQHYLVFNDVTPIEETGDLPGIRVYRYKPDNFGCGFQLFQKLEFDNLVSMTAFRFGPESRQELFLAAVNSSALLVWRQDGHSGFTQSWPMRVNDAQFVESVFVDERLFLIVGQKSTGLLIFEAVTKGHPWSSLVLEKSFNPKDDS